MKGWFKIYVHKCVLAFMSLCVCVYNYRALTPKPQWAEGWERGASGLQKPLRIILQEGGGASMIPGKLSREVIGSTFYVCICECLPAFEYLSFNNYLGC